MQKFVGNFFAGTPLAFSLALVSVLMIAVPVVAVEEAPEGFEVLFNGEDFTNWIVPEGDGGHWKIIDGVIVEIQDEHGNPSRVLKTNSL